MAARFAIMRGHKAAAQLSRWTEKMTDLSYRSPKTEVRESAIHGKGLFAKEKIAKGEIVSIKGGSILNKEVWSPEPKGVEA